jgi:hypothetical protein
MYSPKIGGDFYVVPPVTLAAELYPSIKNFPGFIAGLHRSSDRYPSPEVVLSSPRPSIATSPGSNSPSIPAVQVSYALPTPAKPSPLSPSRKGTFPLRDIAPLYQDGRARADEKDSKDLFREEAAQATEDLRKFLWEKYPPYDEETAGTDTFKDLTQAAEYGAEQRPQREVAAFAGGHTRESTQEGR